MKFIPELNLKPSAWPPKSVTFLDTKVTVDDEWCFTTDLYVKLTDTHQYLHEDSCHPGDCKRSIPYSQALKICCICSEKSDYLKRNEELTEFLTNQGYEENDVHHKLIEQKDSTEMRCLVVIKENNYNMLREWVSLILTHHPSLTLLNHIPDKHSSILNISKRLRKAVKKEKLKGIKTPFYT